MRTNTRQRKRKRTIAPLAAVAAVAALTAISVSGDQQRTGSTPRQRAAQGLTVVRDADTGELREPTPQELIDLQSQSAQTATAPEPIVSATGFEGLSLGDDQMTFTVATRNPDGTVSISHAAGKKNAERQVREGAVPRGLVAGKEQPLDR